MWTLVMYALLGLVACAVSCGCLAAVLHYRTGPPIDVAGWVGLRIAAFVACLLIVDNVPGTATLGEFAWSSVSYWIGDRWGPVVSHSAVLLPLTALVLLGMADSDLRRRGFKSLFYSSAGFGAFAVFGLGLAIFLGLRAVTAVDIPAHLDRADGLVAVLGTVGGALFLMFAYVCMSIPLLIWICGAVTTTFNASTSHPMLAPVGTAAVAVGMFTTSLPNASSPSDVVFQMLSVGSVVAASWGECVRLRRSLGISWSRPFPDRELYYDADGIPDDPSEGAAELLDRFFDDESRAPDRIAMLVGLVAKPRWRWSPSDPGPALSAEDVGDLYGQANTTRRPNQGQDIDTGPAADGP